MVINVITACEGHDGWIVTAPLSGVTGRETLHTATAGAHAVSTFANIRVSGRQLETGNPAATAGREFTRFSLDWNWGGKMVSRYKALVRQPAGQSRYAVPSVPCAPVFAKCEHQRRGLLARETRLDRPRPRCKHTHTTSADLGTGEFQTRGLDGNTISLSTEPHFHEVPPIRSRSDERLISLLNPGLPAYSAFCRTIPSPDYG